MVEPASGPEKWLGDEPSSPVPGEPARRGGKRWLGDQRLGPRQAGRGQGAVTGAAISPIDPAESPAPAEQSEVDELAEAPSDEHLPEPTDEEHLPEPTDEAELAELPGEEDPPESPREESVGELPSEEESSPGDGTAAGEGETGERSSGLFRRAGSAIAGNRVAAILGVLTVGLAVALALTMVQLGNKSSLDTARTSALSAAKTYSVDLAAYDYRQLGKDFGVVLAHSTPSFRHSFTDSSDALKSTLTKYHATSKASVVAAGVISASTSRAVVLVFLNQTVSNSTQKKPTTDRSQVEISLVRDGGHWMIDQVSLL